MYSKVDDQEAMSIHQEVRVSTEIDIQNMQDSHGRQSELTIRNSRSDSQTDDSSIIDYQKSVQETSDPKSLSIFTLGKSTQRKGFLGRITKFYSREKNSVIKEESFEVKTLVDNEEDEIPISDENATYVGFLFVMFSKSQDWVHRYCFILDDVMHICGAAKVYIFLFFLFFSFRVLLV
jgi:hypothetical protein